MVTTTAPSQSTWPSGLALVANSPSSHSLSTAAKDPPPLSERPFSRSTCGKSRMREFFTYGSVRGATGNGRPYPRSPRRCGNRRQRTEFVGDEAWCVPLPVSWACDLQITTPENRTQGLTLADPLA